jgi:predicted nuclease of predicted toxin-antitoxin system
VRILLDESLPRTLTRHLSGVAVETVYDRGWSGLQNGELLNRAVESFDVFFTADQNLPYQQNLAGRGIRVVVLAAVTNRVDDLVPLLCRAVDLANQLEPGAVGVVRSDSE